MVSVRPSSYGCMQEVAEDKQSILACAPLALQVFSNFPSAPIPQWTHDNHEPTVFQNFSFSKPIESLQTCISMASLHHQFMEHVDVVGKFLG